MALTVKDLLKIEKLFNKLFGNRLKKLEKLMKQQVLPKEVINVHSFDEFNRILNEYDKIIIIDLWAVWCGPCMIFAPIFEKLQQEYKAEFVFAKVNVDEIPEVARRYGVTGIPTTLFIKKEKILQKIVGAMNYDSMKQLIEKMKDYNH